MSFSLCPSDGALLGQSRVAIGASPETGIRAWEFGLLLAAGAGTMVLSDLVEFKLRLPGHAIVRAIPLLALGLALVPRRGGGSVTAFGAVLGALALRGFGWETGLGAVASAVFFGPLVDVLIRWARSGWQLYVAFGLAGLLTNLVALAVQASSKWMASGGGGGGGGGGGRSFGGWLAVASVSYPICGLVAGLISAALWFRMRSQSDSSSHEAKTARETPL